MNAGKAVYGILSGTTAVTDIVGTRIFPEIAEQEAVTPFIIYQLLSVDPEDTHDGPSKLDEVRFEFLCYADSYNEAADLGVAVRGALDRVSGTYNGVNVESVQFNDVDVEIEYDPRRYSQVLKFTFRIKRDDIEIALGTPVTGAELGDLSDVNVTGVTDNQILSYDAATDTWIPADDAGGPEQLNDLSDVNVLLPSEDEFLRYDGAEWINDSLSISQVQGLQAALDATPDALSDLTDVKIVGTPSEGDALVYSSGFWARGTAGASTLGDLDDVNTTGAGVGSTITYNGSTWEISGAALPSDDIYYHDRYATEAGTLRSGATETVELYYTAQADGDGLDESAESDTASAGNDIRRKLYYSEAAQADPDTGTWTQFTAIADNTTFANAKAALLAYLKERTGGTVPISLKMTWEEVAQAPAFTGLLNESYGSGAEAAYSTRRLNGNVTDCMVIRRASDSTTQTIGFDGSGNIDEAAIETFCTGTTCTVYQWLDQSGNGNDATAAAPANEPTIYTGGVLVKEGGRLALDFDGTNDILIIPNATSLQIVGDLYFANVLATEGISLSPFFTKRVDDNNREFEFRNSSSTQFSYLDSANRKDFSIGATSSRQLYSVNRISNLSVNFNLDGYSYAALSLTGTQAATTADVAIGARVDLTHRFDGRMQEILLYASNKSSVRTSIESNIGDYFTQNTPLLDTYSGAAAAYSLRKLRTAYTGDAITVRRASDNFTQGIGFNVFGELDTVSLAAFCGASDGFVDTWHDQSGNGNDATQGATAQQPKIYDGTTGVVTENGKPAVEFDGSDDSLTNSTPPFTGTTARTSFTVSKANTSTSDDIIYGINRVSTDAGKGWQLTAETQVRVFGGRQEFNNSAQTIHSLGTLIFSGTTVNDANFYLNGSTTTKQTGTGTIIDTDGTDFGIGQTPDYALYYDGKQQELIFYASDQSSNRTNIEDNINTFYSIY